MQLTVLGDNFEYDTYLLIREFYPRENIVRLYENTGAFLPEEGGYICEYGEEVTKISFFSEGGTYDKTEFELPLQIPDDDPVRSGQDGIDYYQTKADKKKYKKIHMGNLYTVLQKVTGQSLPWGNLTGVRPTKLARVMLDDGAGDDEVLRFYRTERFVSAEKSALALEIAKREREILSPIDSQEGYSLYIGIPFCPTRCSYCSFLSNPIAKWQDRVEEYLSCIKKELQFVQTTFVGRIPDTIYIGGGTPTALSASELETLMEMIEEFLMVQKGQKVHSSEESSGKLFEFTVEAGRPDSITPEKLRVLKAAGVNRISVNPQTMNDETLVRIGRKHTVAQTLTAYELAREEGFDNINMDLILGLPGEGISEIKRTMDEIIRLSPDSLTVHSLAIKRSAEMAGLIREGEDADSLGLDRNPVEMMKIAYEGAKSLDLKPYYLYRQKNIAGNLENVGFAKDGKFGIYNILMMEEVQSIVALGAGTVSKLVLPGDIKRCDTAKDIGLYMDNIDEMTDRKRTLFGRHES